MSHIRTRRTYTNPHVEVELITSQMEQRRHLSKQTYAILFTLQIDHILTKPALITESQLHEHHSREVGE